jgi:sugar transferase (PEP-CTERM/EpsH1 system associated)
VTAPPENPQKLILHVVYSFGVGGLENVIVQLVNRLPRGQYKHAILALSTVTDFRDRIKRDDVEIIALNKPPGHAFSLYPEIFRLFCKLKPDVVHTCNLAALEIQPLAWLTGIRNRVHAEHGLEMSNAKSDSRRRLLRRFYKFFVSRQIAVSEKLFDYLKNEIGVPEESLKLIANGVDTTIFLPRELGSSDSFDMPFAKGQQWTVGSVGRLEHIKNQVFLARAFVLLIQRHPECRGNLRLAIVGEGRLKAQIAEILKEGQVLELAWLPSERNDIPDILANLDCFVLPSYSEGTSCTLQEAMASSLPVVATAVGGTPALIENGINGTLVQPDDDEALATAIYGYYINTGLAKSHGKKAREQAERDFSIESMIQQYESVFND